MSYFLRDRLLLDLSPCTEQEREYERKSEREREREKESERKKERNEWRMMEVIGRQGE